MKPVGPYTPIRQAGNLFFVSGQIGIEPDSQNMVDGIEAQTQQVMNNLAAVLAEAGLSVTDIVKATIYLKDIADYETVNEIYADGLNGNKPARAAFAVSDLPKDALVEIEAIAYKSYSKPTRQV